MNYSLPLRTLSTVGANTKTLGHKSFVVLQTLIYCLRPSTASGPRRFAMEAVLTFLTVASNLVPVPLLSELVTTLSEILTPRTLEENVLLFQTRSQSIGSLSSVVGVQT